MSTQATLRTALAARLGDPTNLTWTTTELNEYLSAAIRSLYPSFFQRRTGTTSAEAGPMQTPPAGAENIHYVGLQRTGSTRVRPLRGWQEGQGEVMVPKLGITGMPLHWGWTVGWDTPGTDTETLTFPLAADEVVLLRAQITALEHIITNRVKAESYFATNVRQAITEDDVATTLDALHTSLNARLAAAPILPDFSVGR